VTDSGAASARLLDGLRVLDLTRVLAGPIAGRILADLGADVVKLEPPEGDLTRSWGRVIGGLSGYYTRFNAGKRNICVDLTKSEGPELVRALAAASDVVIENFRPGVLEKLGLSWTALREGNPRLVMLSISGFGQHGEDSQRGAYAGVVHAESGVIARQARLDGIEPLDLIMSVSDVLAGLHGVIGLLAAVTSARTTGRGQHVDVAMLHAMCFSDDGGAFTLDGVSQDRSASVWRTRAGSFYIAAHSAQMWKSLSRTHDLQDGLPPDATVEDKIRARHAAVQRFFDGLQDRNAVGDALDRARLMWGELRDGESVYTAPSLRDRDAVRWVDDRAGGQRRVIDSPYRFSDADSGVRGAARYLGEDNADVLTDWLGFEDAEVAHLTTSGVLRAVSP
jgi:crotonobetainyl-CoA:carnitine CoA-transferase CaiB-like acyl-CoA transferase